MQIGIGLPNPVGNVEGQLLIDWARFSEDRGFSSLATIDRIAYPSFESLIALAAAGAATTKIGLMTNILLAPLRSSVLLAKQVVTLDEITGGRFTLGVGVGGREDDYMLAEANFKTRGRRLEDMLALIENVWRGQALDTGSKSVAPGSGREPKIVMGGTSAAAFRRMAKHAIGWTAGGMGPEPTAKFADKAKVAWIAAGREGKPRIYALAYFSIGDDVEEASVAYLRDYYAFAGDRVEQIALGIPRGETACKEMREAYEDAGVDELFFVPTVGQLDQIDRLAAAVL